MLFVASQMMLKDIMYDRKSALEYAKKWAFKRNPKYLDFENIGGDCTNFVSQCLYAGCPVMNYTPIYGWYYKNSYDRSPSWTGVEFLYNFLTDNKTVGPYGIISNRKSVQAGDIILLGDKDNHFYHTVIISAINRDDIFVTSHSIDSYMRPLSSYIYDKVRYIHIVAGRKNI